MRRDLQLKSRSSIRKKRRNRKVKDMNQLCLFPLEFINIESQKGEQNGFKSTSSE